MRRMIGTRWRLKPHRNSVPQSHNVTAGTPDFMGAPSQSLTMWATCLVEADAMDEVLEVWIMAQGVKAGMHFEELQNV
jgi:hypothetical protein